MSPERLAHIEWQLLKHRDHVGNADLALELLAEVKRLQPAPAAPTEPEAPVVEAEPAEDGGVAKAVKKFLGGKRKERPE